MKLRTIALPVILFICLIVATRTYSSDAVQAEPVVPKKPVALKQKTETKVLEIAPAEADVKEAEKMAVEQEDPAVSEETEGTEIINLSRVEFVVEEVVETEPAEPDPVEPDPTEPVEPMAVEVTFSEDADDELLTPADEFYFHDHTPLGMHTVTWYSYERAGNNVGAAEVDGGLVPGLSCAMPDASLLGRTILIENYGYFRVDDIGPAGVADIFVWSDSDIPAYGMDYQMVYLVN